MCGCEGDGTKAMGDDVGRRYELGGKCAVAKAERLRRLWRQYGRWQFFFHIFLFFLLTFRKIVCKYSFVPDGGVAQLVRAEES